MSLFINKSEMQGIMKDLYSLAGVRIVLIDENRRNLMYYPEKMCEYCTQIRQADEVKNACKACDSELFEICGKTKKPALKKCHAGLIDALVPIVENDKIAGYVGFGQMTDSEDKKEICRLARIICKKYDLNLSKTLAAADRIQYMPQNKFEACANIFSVICASLLSSHKIAQKTDSFAELLSDYIEKHISDDLNASVVCNEFHISKSTLYNQCKGCFGCGINELIKTMRLEKAAEWLHYKGLMISKISEKVGFDDANYFTKVFTKKYNMTPKEYQKKYAIY